MVGNTTFVITSRVTRLLTSRLVIDSRVVVNELKMTFEQEGPQPQLMTHVHKIENLVQANRRLTVREFGEDIEISIVSCHDILSE